MSCTPKVITPSWHIMAQSLFSNLATKTAVWVQSQRPEFFPQMKYQILTNLKSSWAPVHKLNSPLSLDGGNGSIDIFGYNITSIQQTARHVLAMTRITLNHLVCWFEASTGDLSHTELLMVGLLSRDDRCICSQREVNSWIRHQVGLEFQNSLKLI